MNENSGNQERLGRKIDEPEVFNRNLIGIISAARLVAIKHGVSNGEASHCLEMKLRSAGANIYRMCEGEPPWLLGQAWSPPECDEILEVLSCEWWNHPKLLECELPGHRYLPNEYAIEWRAAKEVLGLERSNDGEHAELSGHFSAEPNSRSVFIDQELVERTKDAFSPSVSGETFDGLMRAISAFPHRYPEYKTRLPKLENDVRPWLLDTKMASNDREARVFSTIIFEHFKLSPDTQKTQ